MKAKGIFAVLAVVGLLVFVAVSVLGGSKDKAASMRTVSRVVEGEVRSPFDIKGKDVPDQINYQGYLVNSDDSSAATGILEMTFRIYDAETDGFELWSETDTVEVSNGLFNVLLGTPTALFTGQDLWLETTVNGETLLPRKKLVSVPYAFKDECWTSSGDDCYFAKSGNVGIGTTSPSHQLHITGDMRINDIKQLCFYNAAGTGLQGVIYANDATDKFLVHSGAIRDLWLGSYRDIEFNTYETDWSEKMTIKTNGNVGIGTTEPGSYKLNVYGTAKVGGGQTGDLLVIVPGDAHHAASGIEWDAWSGSWGYIRMDRLSWYQKKMYLGCNASGSGFSPTTAITIDGTNDNNVGIGTTNPARKLHVNDVMRLEPRASFPSSPSDGDLCVVGSSGNRHIYCYLNGGWRQLD